MLYNKQPFPPSLPYHLPNFNSHLDAGKKERKKTNKHNTKILPSWKSISYDGRMEYEGRRREKIWLVRKTKPVFFSFCFFDKHISWSKEAKEVEETCFLSLFIRLKDGQNRRETRSPREERTQTVPPVLSACHQIWQPTAIENSVLEAPKYRTQRNERFLRHFPLEKKKNNKHNERNGPEARVESRASARPSGLVTWRLCSGRASISPELFGSCCRHQFDRCTGCCCHRPLLVRCCCWRCSSTTTTFGIGRKFTDEISTTTIDS